MVNKIIALILFLFLAVPVGAAVLNYSAEHDTLLDESAPTTKYSTDTEVTALDDDAFLIRFDLSTHGTLTSGDIVQAELRLYETLRGGGHNLILSRLVRDWNETDADWVDATSSDTWGTSGAKNLTSDVTTTGSLVFGNANDDWLIVDVTDLVGDMLDSGNDYGFLIRGEAENAYDVFATDEYGTSSLRPELIIRTGTPGVPETWYVREGGGTCGLGNQCTGLTDADYPGSGTDQDCACALPTQADDIMSGEDILVIEPGGEFTLTSAFDPPSGATASLQTKIYGRDPNGTCTNPATLLGDVGTTAAMVSLEDNTLMECFTITDTNGCIYAGSAPMGGKIDNEATQDYINCADGNSGSGGVGIQLSGSSGVDLKDINIYGMAFQFIQGIEVGDFSMTNMDMKGAGFAGWDTDFAEAPYSGTHTWTNVTLQYSGCGWRAKATPAGDAAGTPHNCYNQTAGGYGDGYGPNATSADLVEVQRCNVSFNTSDGLDFLYTSDGAVKIAQCIFEGNAGAGFKTGNAILDIENNLVLGNCSNWLDSPWVYGSPEAPGRSGSNCNTDGTCDANENYTNCSADCIAFDVCRPSQHASLSLAYTAGETDVNIHNNTITGNSDVMVYFSGTCNAMDSLNMQNNIFIGATEYNGGESDTADAYWTDCTGTTPTPTIDYNIFCRTKDGDTDCTQHGGLNNLCYADVGECEDIVVGTLLNWTPNYYQGNDYASAFYLEADSPAIGAGTDGLTYWHSSNDVNNFTRTSTFDIGGLEYGSVPSWDEVVAAAQKALIRGKFTVIGGVTIK